MSEKRLHTLTIPLNAGTRRHLRELSDFLEALEEMNGGAYDEEETIAVLKQLRCYVWVDHKKEGA